MKDIIKSIEDRIQEIDEILDADSVEDRKQSALSRIQENMTKWAKELELEHCDSPYRLDLNKVTVVVDKPDRPVPLFLYFLLSHSLQMLIEAPPVIAYSVHYLSMVTFLE